VSAVHGAPAPGVCRWGTAKGVSTTMTKTELRVPVAPSARERRVFVFCKCAPIRQASEAESLEVPCPKQRVAVFPFSLHVASVVSFFSARRRCQRACGPWKSSSPDSGGRHSSLPQGPKLPSAGAGVRRAQSHKLCPSGFCVSTTAEHPDPVADIGWPARPPQHPWSHLVAVTPRQWARRTRHHLLRSVRRAHA